jgi:hypothetical protein
MAGTPDDHFAKRFGEGLEAYEAYFLATSDKVRGLVAFKNECTWAKANGSYVPN